MHYPLRGDVPPHHHHPVKTLSLEASSATVSLAVSEYDRIISSHRFLAPRGRGAEIFLALENLRPAWIDVDRIAVGVGPGSYNGLRTACALAQSLALVLQCEIVTCPSPCLLDVGEEHYFAVGDARGGRLWRAEVVHRKITGDITLVTPDEFTSQLKTISDRPVYRVGSIPRLINLPESVPTADLLAALAPRLRPLNPDSPAPIYLKPPHITLPRAQADDLPAGTAKC